MWIGCSRPLSCSLSRPAMGGLLSVAATEEAESPREAGLAPGADPLTTSRATEDCKQFLREASGRLSDFYVRVRDLGEGAYGEVFLARQRICAGSGEERAGRLYAVKRVRAVAM